METQKNESRKSDALRPVNNSLQTFLNGNERVSELHDQPIADFFPNCTVFFGDIAGFTAWSSTREPAQVFILLQTVYQNFDSIAKRRKVFKVETIGMLRRHWNLFSLCGSDHCRVSPFLSSRGFIRSRYWVT